MIENMAYFQCGHCDEKTYIFGKHGARDKVGGEMMILMSMAVVCALLCFDTPLHH